VFEQEVIQLRGEAAELLDHAERQGRPVTPEEDAEILELLERALTLELQCRQRKGLEAYLTISRAAL
jgi:hypothetical protein